MAQYRMTAEQIIDFNYNFNMYCERLSNITNVMHGWTR